jgi:hypothetical protein
MKHLDSSSSHLKDSRKSNLWGFSAPGGGDGQVLRRLVSQPGVTEGNPRKKAQNKIKPRRGDRNLKDRRETDCLYFLFDFTYVFSQVLHDYPQYRGRLGRS